MTSPASPLRYASMGLVFAGFAYTAVLCFIHTNVFSVTNNFVAMTDGAIVIVALALALWAAPASLWILIIAVAVNFLALALLGDAVSIKAIRDILVLVAFAALGRRFGDPEGARNAFVATSVVVVVFCLLELIAPALYTKVFDVFDFYASRGALSAEQIQYQSSSFFVSGERGEGRLIAPFLTFLGAHRAASVFLEPVSLGNFGALVGAFAIALPREQRRLAWVMGGVAVLAVFAADARFAAASLLFFLVARATPLGWINFLLTLLPLASIALIVGVSAVADQDGDTLLSRLAVSGAVLTSLDPGALFGLRPGAVSTVDAGYAYALTNFGLPLCVFLWGAFVLFPARTEPALRFKLFLGIYACALLCVSGSSLFALKTAAVAWFALGALAAAPLRRRAARGAPDVMEAIPA